jgi:hypothetical protein
LLLKNHGAVAVGRDLDEAFERIEMIEQFAKIVLTARLLGRVETLAPGDVSRLLSMAQQPGEPGSPWRCSSCRGCSAGAGGTGSAGAGQAPDERRMPRAPADAVSEDVVARVTEIVRRRLSGG